MCAPALRVYSRGRTVNRRTQRSHPAVVVAGGPGGRLFSSLTAVSSFISQPLALQSVDQAQKVRPQLAGIPFELLLKNPFHVVQLTLS